MRQTNRTPGFLVLVLGWLIALPGCGDETGTGSAAPEDHEDALQIDIGDETASGDLFLAEDTTPEDDPAIGLDSEGDTSVRDAQGDAGGPSVDPWQDGPYEVTIQRVGLRLREGSGWLDPDLNVEIDLYLPDVEGPRSVVLFNHGFMLAGGAYAAYGKRLASHGIVGVFPSWGDNLLAPWSHVELAEYTVELFDWLAEQAEDSESPLHYRVDLNRLGVGGHSRGGKQSVFAAILDDRVRASFNVDPVDSAPPVSLNPEGYPSVTPDMMGGFTIPSGYVGSGLGGEAGLGGQSCAPVDENYHQYFLHSPTPSVQYLLPDVGHLDLVDDCGLLCTTCPSGDQAEFGHAFSVATMTAFYLLYLDEDSRFRPWVTGTRVVAHGELVEMSTR